MLISKNRNPLTQYNLCRIENTESRSGFHSATRLRARLLSELSRIRSRLDATARQTHQGSGRARRETSNWRAAAHALVVGVLAALGV